MEAAGRHCGGFSACYYIPVGNARFDNAVMEAFHLVKWYAQEHVLLCLVPAFFIAGAIGVFVSQEGVMKYLGPTASKWIAYPVASVSGTVLAVCSCTVLPLFAGIWTRGAGLGPASAFLYSGPAINVLGDYSHRSNPRAGNRSSQGCWRSLFQRDHWPLDALHFSERRGAAHRGNSRGHGG